MAGDRQTHEKAQQSLWKINIFRLSGEGFLPVFASPSPYQDCGAAPWF
jgi:hypothetical protein